MKRLRLKKGKRRFKPRRIGFAFNPKYLQFDVMFTKESDPKDEQDPPAIQKLYGYTFGLNPHHNSIRVGWNVKDGKVNLYDYVYRGKLRFNRLLKQIDLNQKATVTIRKGINHNTWNIDISSFNGDEMEHVSHEVFMKDSTFAFLNSPYCEDHNQDIEIYVDNLKYA